MNQDTGGGPKISGGCGGAPPERPPLSCARVSDCGDVLCGYRVAIVAVGAVVYTILLTGPWSRCLALLQPAATQGL
jgi:hypothetical protein